MRHGQTLEDGDEGGLARRDVDRAALESGALPVGPLRPEQARGGHQHAHNHDAERPSGHPTGHPVDRLRNIALCPIMGSPDIPRPNPATNLGAA
jgi:hypothetical protein